MACARIENRRRRAPNLEHLNIGRLFCVQDDGVPSLGEKPSAVDDIGIVRERFQEGAGER